MEENHYREAVCPACGIIDRFGDKWSLRILVLLQKNGTMRFNELMRNVPNISQKMLTTALKKLEADMLVNRKLYPEIPPKVEYSLTPLGESLMLPLDGIIQWALDGWNRSINISISSIRSYSDASTNVPVPISS